MLNLAGFGPQEHQLMAQARIEGLRDILGLPLAEFQIRLRRAAQELNIVPPDDLRIDHTPRFRFEFNYDIGVLGSHNGPLYQTQNRP